MVCTVVDTGFAVEVEGFAVEVEGFVAEVEGFVAEVEGFVASVAVVEEEFVEVFILDDGAVVPGEFSEATVDVTAEVSDVLSALSVLSAEAEELLSLSDEELISSLPEEALLFSLSEEESLSTVEASDIADEEEEVSDAGLEPFSALQPHAEVISAAHRASKIIRFFMFLSFCLRFNVTLQDFVFDYTAIILQM